MKNSNKNNNATLQATLTTEQLLKLKDTEVKQLGGLEEQTTTKKQLQLNPVKTYINSDTEKENIYSENRNKTGIYLFTNKINEKRYIGSSNNLKRRFSEYFNDNYLLRNKSMGICCALLKHGSSNFSITILEYCEVSELLIREKHY